MKWKQKVYTGRTLNPKTGKYDYYEILTPEYVPDYSWIVPATQTVSALIVVGLAIGKMTGVI